MSILINQVPDLLTTLTDPPSVSPQNTLYSIREIVETHKRAVYFLSLDLTGNQHDAEDLSQEVFIKAYTGLKNYRGDAQMYTWLRRIAINTYLNSKRKKSVSMMGLSNHEGAELQHASLEPDPEQWTDQIITRKVVERALDTLSPRERTAFVLRHHQELNTAEVASAMEVADGTVKSLLFRATKKLQKELIHLKDSAVRLSEGTV